jgi:sugar lactone lactonase YvrE
LLRGTSRPSPAPPAYGYNGDNIAATSAQLYQPSGVAVDSSGNLYIADTANSRVRKVNTSGTITTVSREWNPRLHRRRLSRHRRGA